MRKLIAALIILLLSVGAALWLHRQGGLVIVSLGEWTLQTSVLLFVLSVLIGVALLYAVIGLLRTLAGVPGRMQGWVQRRRGNRARSHLIQGLLRLTEGRGEEAEKLLTRDVDRSDAPLLHYLAAAIAAQRQSDFDQRDRYLALADKADAKASLAIGLLQAQLRIESRQWEQAFATLNYLNEKSPNHPRLLAMLLRCCEALNEWDRIETLLPAARRQHAVSEAELRRLERAAAYQRLQRAGSAAAVEAAWNGMNRSLRSDPALQRLYVDGLMATGRADEAERFLRAQLGREYDPELARLYGGLPVSAPERALAQAEKWLQERPEDPALLQAAGRLAVQARVWGRARSYLEAAAARQPDPVTYRLLGALLEQLGESDAARDCYRKALEHGTENRAGLSAAEQRALAQARAEQD